MAEDLPAREGMHGTAVPAPPPWQIQWGDFLAALINFIIIAFVVFLVAKYMFREEKVTKKKVPHFPLFLKRPVRLIINLHPEKPLQVQDAP